MRIPYVAKDFSMLIILPDEGYKIEDMIQHHMESPGSVEELKDKIMTATSKYVMLRLPKFTAEFKTGLFETLRSLEVHSAFDRNEADFSKMSGNALQQNSRLHLSEAVHKVVIEASDDGFEDAAGTKLYYETNCRFLYPNAPGKLTVDRPSVFMVVYKENNFVHWKNYLTAAKQLV